MEPTTTGETSHLSGEAAHESAPAKEVSPGVGLVQLIVAPEEQAIERARMLRERLKTGGNQAAAR